MKQTQKQWVMAQLKERGEITRNQCLQRRISRLSAIALTLKGEGWELDGSDREGDYVYKVIKPAQRKVTVYDLMNGVRVPRITYVPV